MKPKDWIAAALTALIAAGVSGVTAEWTGRIRLENFRRATAHLAAHHVSTLNTGPAAAIAGLARRYSGTGKLEPKRMDRSLRLTSRGHPSLTRVMVADLEGRILAIYRPDRPPGRTGSAPSGLDEVDRRRKALLKTGLPVEIRMVEAGAVTRLELAAPILDDTGELRAYAAGTVSLARLRSILGTIERKGGVRLTLTDARGNLVYPLKGRRVPPRTSTLLTGGYRLHVAAQAGMGIWAAAVTFLTVMILASALLWVRRRPAANPVRPEPDETQPTETDVGNPSK